MGGQAGLLIDMRDYLAAQRKKRLIEDIHQLLDHLSLDDTAEGFLELIREILTETEGERNDEC